MIIAVGLIDIEIGEVGRVYRIKKGCANVDKSILFLRMKSKISLNTQFRREITIGEAKTGRLSQTYPQIVFEKTGIMSIGRPIVILEISFDAIK